MDIWYLDVMTNSAEQHAMVGTLLRAIYLPGMETSTGYRIVDCAGACTFSLRCEDIGVGALKDSGLGW